MGFKEWRQRQLDRADRMTAWADKTDAELDEAQDVRTEAQTSAAVDARDERLRAVGAALGFDHEAVMARATAVGMDGPRVWTPSRGLVTAEGVANILNPLSQGLVAGEVPRTQYRAWVASVVREERARGIELPWPGR